MRATISIAILFLLLSFDNFALSQTAEAQEFKLGDKIPEQIMKTLSKDTETSSKPTIINFWATWCVPCIKELKLLDSVLNETDGINVLSVTYENDVPVESFLERNKELKSGRLTILTSDTLLKTYFPHRLIPHDIWIETEGTVKYITGGEEMSKENILSFINGKQLNIKNKEDNRKFNPFEPFHLSDSEFVYRSILTKRIDGIPSGNAIYPVGHADKQKILRVFSFNSI